MSAAAATQNDKPEAVAALFRRLKRLWMAVPKTARRETTTRATVRRAPALALVAPVETQRPAPATLEALHAQLLEPVPGGDPDAVAPELSRLLRWLAAEAFREMFRP
jgi:hypothetical protein